MTIAQTINSYRQSFVIYSDCRRHSVAQLCEAYNWATSPTRLMDDKEHRACRHFARVILSKLSRYSGWRECDSGRLLAS